MGTEEKIERLVDGYAGSWWVPHNRTGIYYPIGQERVMENVPIEAAKFAEVIHCFTSREAVHVLGGRERFPKPLIDRKNAASSSSSANHPQICTEFETLDLRKPPPKP
ncbi:hypothetical protein MRB53_013323 [Persea americana]|uniref:Uncharacterized protein n=1 Tax=Persea americana TaxID=3435 RepID=A0ACC2K823_PERAE|nr:hypothetical protein MRB53_013323 [Persea americana]